MTTFFRWIAIIRIKHLIRSQIEFLRLSAAEINVSAAERRANCGLKRLQPFSNLAALTPLFKVNAAKA